MAWRKPCHLAQGLHCFHLGCSDNCWKMCWWKSKCRVSLNTYPCLVFLAIPSLSASVVHSRCEGLAWPQVYGWGRTAACRLRGGSKTSCRMGWALWDSTWKIQEWCSLTSSGEFRSSKSSSILSTNSSVNRICKGNTVFYAFTLLVLANWRKTMISAESRLYQLTPSPVSFFTAIQRFEGKELLTLSSTPNTEKMLKLYSNLFWPSIISLSLKLEAQL